jgi:aminoglycoside phosphotransferase (APT) family kinase protein
MLYPPTTDHKAVTAPDSLHGIALQQLLPETLFGEARSVTPIQIGLSGAGVYAVDTAKGKYILRIQSADSDRNIWVQHLLILRRAAEHGVAPPIVHVEDSAQAIVSVRINGAPLPSVLGNPTLRQTAITDVVSRIHALHTIDVSGVEERDAVAYARNARETQSRRAGFPTWAAQTSSILDQASSVLARDTRRVVSHNDVNPGNVLWDGARSWLVDWEAAALGHPYYDLAAFVSFLDLDAERAHELLELQEQSRLDGAARETFTVLRRLVAVMVGNIFLSMVPSLGVVAVPARIDAPTLAQCYAAMRRGELDLQTAHGQAMFGLAFLRIATER